MRLSSILTAAALVAVGTTAFAQSPLVQNATAGAAIVASVSITPPANQAGMGTNDLYWGKFVSPAAPVTVTLTPDAATGTRNHGALVLAAGDVWRIPSYTVAARGVSAITLTLNGPAIITCPAGSMAVGNWRLFDATGTQIALGGAASANLASNGAYSATVQVAADLTVPANARQGDYTGSYTLTATYN